MCTRLTEIFSDIQISRIRVTGKDHVASSKSDSIIGVCSEIV